MRLNNLITCRNYAGIEDYWKIDSFLINNYQSGNADLNWLEPAWEYMHFHSLLDFAALPRIGIWEDGGEIVGVVTFEWRLGDAFFQFHHEYKNIRMEMLDYAESQLYGIRKEDGKKFLTAFVADKDTEMKLLVKSRGYTRLPAEDRPMMMYDIPHPIPGTTLPKGYSLTSLAEDCDWVKVNRVLWRGFDHPGEPPATQKDLEERQKMFDTPTASRDLKIVIKAPNGEFASFAVTFFQAVNHFAYVEPVATDPDHRRLGLGKAAVLEGIWRCAMRGADKAYVANDLPIYRSIGFILIYTVESWQKALD